MLRFLECRQMEGSKHRVRCEGCPAFKKKNKTTTGKNISQPASLPWSDICVLAPRLGYPQRLPRGLKPGPRISLQKRGWWPRGTPCQPAAVPGCPPASPALCPIPFLFITWVFSSPFLSLFAGYLRLTHKSSNHPFSGLGKLRHAQDRHHLFTSVEEHEAKPHAESTSRGRSNCSRAAWVGAGSLPAALPVPKPSIIGGHRARSRAETRQLLNITGQREEASASARGVF